MSRLDKFLMSSQVAIDKMQGRTTCFAWEVLDDMTGDNRFKASELHRAFDNNCHTRPTCEYCIFHEDTLIEPAALSNDLGGVHEQTKHIP